MNSEQFVYRPNWVNILWFVFTHTAALAGIVLFSYFWSWQGFFLFVVTFVLTGWLGVSVGNHRLFTHGSFQTTRWMRAIIGICAVSSG